MPAEAAPSYLSGLLIGAEIASVPRLLGVEAGSPLALVGDPQLCGWYARALEHRGWPAQFHDGDEAVVAGLRALNNGGVL
jgi:2-dehydro-3-deoxygalactonokinase